MLGLKQEHRKTEEFAQAMGVGCRHLLSFSLTNDGPRWRPIRVKVRPVPKSWLIAQQGLFALLAMRRLHRMPPSSAMG